MNMPISASKKEHLFSRIKGCFFIINVAHTKTLVCSSLLDEIGWFKNNRQIYLQYIVYYIYIHIYIFSYIYMQIYRYMYLHIYSNSPVNVIVKLPHPQRGDSQGQEMHPLLTSKPATMTQSAQTIFSLYQS